MPTIINHTPGRRPNTPTRFVATVATEAEALAIGGDTWIDEPEVTGDGWDVYRVLERRDAMRPGF